MTDDNIINLSTTEPFKAAKRKGDAKGKSAEPRYKLVPFDQIEIAAGASYLVKGLIPASGLVVIWGETKSGKSFFTLILRCTWRSAGSIAAGASIKG